MAEYFKMTAEYRLKQRYFPKGAMAINSPDGLGVCYVAPYSTAIADSWQVVAYAGTAGKPSSNNYFRSRGAGREESRIVFHFPATARGLESAATQFRQAAHAQSGRHHHKLMGIRSD